MEIKKFNEHFSDNSYSADDEHGELKLKLKEFLYDHNEDLSDDQIWNLAVMLAENSEELKEIFGM